MNYKSPILRYHDLGQETVGNAKQLNPSFRGVAKFLQQISKNGPIFELYLLNFRVKYFFKIRAELYIYFQNVFLFEVRQIVREFIFTNIGGTPDGQKRIPLISTAYLQSRIVLFTRIFAISTIYLLSFNGAASITAAKPASAAVFSLISPPIRTSSAFFAREGLT